MNAQAKALRDLLDWAREHTSPTDANSPHTLLIAAEAALAHPKPAKPDLPRWRCPCCRSTNVQISLPTWYTETVTGPDEGHELHFAETDDAADISWWYCEDCWETDGGSPEEIDYTEQEAQTS